MGATKIIVNNAAYLQSAITAAASTDTTCISIELTGPNVINLTTPITIPSVLANGKKQLIIEGNGVTIQPATSSGLGTGVPLVQKLNSGISNIGYSFIFRDINFNGRSSDGIGLLIDTANSNIIENCSFSYSTDGLKLVSVLNTSVNNCSAFGINNYGFNIQTSSVVLTRCSFIGLNINNSVGYFFYESGGCSMYDCTGNTANHYIVFDSNANTSVNNFNVNNFSFDQWNSSAILLALSTGYAKLSGLNTMYGGSSSTSTLIRAYSSVTNYSNPHLYVENIPFMHNNVKFETVGGIILGCTPAVPSDVVVWDFKEIYDGQNIFSATRWIGGYVPYYRYAEFFNESKKIITNSITVNGNPL